MIPAFLPLERGFRSLPASLSGEKSLAGENLCAVDRSLAFGSAAATSVLSPSSLCAAMIGSEERETAEEKETDDPEEEEQASNEHRASGARSWARSDAARPDEEKTRESKSPWTGQAATTTTTTTRRGARRRRRRRHTKSSPGAAGEWRRRHQV